VGKQQPRGRPRITACRGCCCGTPRKHPEVDHAALLARLVHGVRDHADVRTSECLGPCAESNVVVVGPSPVARVAGGRPVWLSGVLDAAAVDAVIAWIHSGGPGVSMPPAALTSAVFPRPTSEPNR
jgi:(2Fe-2S) ferredoxin